jgi:hypothetical protein
MAMVEAVNENDVRTALLEKLIRLHRNGPEVLYEHHRPTPALMCLNRSIR